MKRFAALPFRTRKNGAGKIEAQLPTIISTIYRKPFGRRIPQHPVGWQRASGDLRPHSTPNFPSGPLKVAKTLLAHTSYPQRAVRKAKKEVAAVACAVAPNFFFAVLEANEKDHRTVA